MKSQKKRHFYAVTYPRNAMEYTLEARRMWFPYEVYVFPSKAERDRYVNEFDAPYVCFAISAKRAQYYLYGHMDTAVKPGADE